MSEIAGVYDCVASSPLGEQASVITLVADGDGFVGSNTSSLGTLEIKNGRIDGKQVTWQMDMTVPLPMTLEAQAEIDGDRLAGSVKLGPLGTATITGTRRV
jgi:hypothetical protein